MNPEAEFMAGLLSLTIVASIVIGFVLWIGG